MSETCQICNGTGKCKYCNGTGEDPNNVGQPCNHCERRGNGICGECRGTGKERQNLQKADSSDKWLAGLASFILLSPRTLQHITYCRGIPCAAMSGGDAALVELSGDGGETKTLSTERCDEGADRESMPFSESGVR